MQTVIQVLCKGDKSLRDSIANDTRLKEYNLYLVHSKKQHRSPGWAKVRSASREWGAINLVWSSSAHTLTCRVVTKKGHMPYMIVGDFVAYLLACHNKRIVTIVLSRNK